VMGPVPDGPASTVLGPGEGESMTVFGNELTIKAGAEETGGAFCLVDYRAGPAFPGPPPHIHRETVDSFYVLEGELTVRLGDETLTLGPDSFVLVPPGTAHTFSNPGDAPARFLSLMSPGGFEQYFRDLRDAFGDRPPDFKQIVKIASRYDVESAGH
jgi:mannose-6-phosphate isomerase-like protein (cupin superfamily)